MVLTPRLPNVSAHFLGHAHACLCAQADALGFCRQTYESKSLSLSSALRVEDGVMVNGDDPAALLKCG